MNYVTIVGSRSTPENILKYTEELAFQFANSCEWILRSGAAKGMDAAGESGFKRANKSHRMEIYLPWLGFEGNNSNLYGICDNALKIASEIHPAWGSLSQGAKRLHARNCYQVLGQNLDHPSDLIICWTEKGQPIGGTRTAIILGEKYNVPIINLGAISYVKT